MRKSLSVAAIILVVLIGVIVLSGCGGRKTTVKTETGEVEVSEKGAEVKVKSEEGEATYKQGAITETDLGVPIYPEAKITVDGGGSMTMKGQEGESTYMAAAFVTGDSVDEVIEWYRGKLSGKPNFMDMTSTAGGEKIGMFTFRSGDTVKTVVISKGEDDHPGKTVIAISSGTGADLGNGHCPCEQKSGGECDCHRH